MAVSRSLGSSSERQVTGKLPLRIEISEAIADPKQTHGTIDSINYLRGILPSKIHIIDPGEHLPLLS